MRIAINTTPLEGGHQDRGVGQYTRLLIEALQKYQGQHSYQFFTRGQKVPSNDLKNKIALGKPKNVDLVHYPYFDPFFLTLPVFKSKPTVVTVHDLIPIAFGDHFPRGLRGELKWLAQKLSLRGARRIIADSEASKRDIHTLVRYPKERIDVVHLAPSPVFRQINDQSVLDSVSKKFNLPAQFVLYVGDVNWNKNVRGLVKALDVVRRTVLSQGLSLKTLSLKPKLVLVGKAFLDDALSETKEVNRLIQSLGLSGEIVKLGFVSEEDLVAIYNLAGVYVQPSFAEGFGLPVLEAMACGAPTVVAQGSSLDEIAGPAIRIDPNNPSDIARGIHKALSVSDREQDLLKEKGLAWVKQFSWETVAAKTVATYEKVLE